MTVPDWLAHRALTSPGRLALAAGGERLSFGELDRRATDMARRLAALEVVSGMRVALLLRSGLWYGLLAHALARLGAVMVPLNTRLAAEELAWQVADSRATLLVSEEALAAQAAGALRGRDGVRVATCEAVAAARPSEAALREHADLARIQGIVYTSATAGRPKGVMLSFGNYWWNAVASALHLGLHPGEGWLVPLPLYHIGGLVVLWRSVICGTAAIVHDTFDPEAVNAEIDRGDVALVSVVSTMLQRVLDARGTRRLPPGLRCVLLGGGPAPAALVDACLEHRVPIAPTYGLTETTSQVATMLPEGVQERPSSAGRPLPSVEIRVEQAASESAIGRPSPPGEAGEIIVRGPTVMAGYADRPEDTARALRGGWLRTGDLGYLDDRGYLYVLDRRDDLIISGGENIYPAEVEAVLRAHPAVADAGVIGLPDAVWGQVVAAAIVRRPEMPITGDEVRAFCAARLARYKIPKRIWITEGLPRSSSGKLVRRALREQFAASPTPERP